ncbi:MAG: DUF4175 family protein [Alphaproteobacteria bacterium]|nr:DUF4175 family protein [Alphaproteobacteria bacterium]
MPTSRENPPGRMARILSVAVWVAAALLLVLFAVRYLWPTTGHHGDVVALRGSKATADDDLQSKLVPPSQQFSNPVAQQLVDIGTGLVARPRDRQEAARQLYALTEEPDALGDDMTAYLAVRSAYWQLRRDPEVKGSLEAALMLWDTAERLEANSQISSASKADSAARQE